MAKHTLCVRCKKEERISSRFCPSCYLIVAGGG